MLITAYIYLLFLQLHPPQSDSFSPPPKSSFFFLSRRQSIQPSVCTQMRNSWWEFLVGTPASLSRAFVEQRVIIQLFHASYASGFSIHGDCQSSPKAYLCDSLCHCFCITTVRTVQGLNPGLLCDKPEL